MSVIVGIFFLVILVAFMPAILAAVNTFTKSREERDLEKQSEAEKQKRREDEGFGVTVGRFFFGDKAFDNLGSNKKDKKFKEEARLVKEVAAKRGGFESVEELERKTDPNRDITRFNPKGKIGFGFPQINEGKGLDDTPENRALLKLKPKDPEFESAEDEFVSKKNKGKRTRFGR